MDVNWSNFLPTFIGGGLSGGVIFKIIDPIYKGYSSYREKKKDERKIIDKHLDPILKSADELVGKIRSLAIKDFKEISVEDLPAKEDFDKWIPYLNLIYLFAQFWARIQILRLESVFLNIASDKKGKILNGFINALESSQSRLIERSWQRGMGESIILIDKNEFRIHTFREFVEKYRSSDELEKWFNPLLTIISNSKLKENRQKILFYGSILHALIDTLDPKHLITKFRPSWPNKLSKKNVRDLKYRVFKEYLPVVKNPCTYYSNKNRSQSSRQPKRLINSLSGFYLRISKK